jgi:hypothetical protein
MQNPLHHVIKPGVRVEIAPHHDLWMRGARFGTVSKVEDGAVAVKMDHPQVKRLRWFPISDLTPTSWRVE